MRNYLSAAKVETQIYSWTNLFSDCILQKTKHSCNPARSIEQQDSLALQENNLRTLCKNA